jgi:glycosyltransferase involved in cell wall biosynthesis
MAELSHNRSSPARRSREIWVAGYPSHYGGADTELDHQINLWLSCGVEVHLVPNAEPDAAMRADLNARGAHTHAYETGIFRDKVVVSYCNGPFLEQLPKICEAGRPRLIAWANCMTHSFRAELECHRQGLIDLFLFQSRYQREQLIPSLAAIRPVQELERYRPFFDIERWRTPRSESTQSALTATDKSAYYGIGRISRDDAGKFPGDLWRTFSRVTAPHPIKCFVLGFGPNARKKCGVPLDAHGLDWMFWSPAAIPARELYARIHTLMHQTGGSRENWPRVAFEAWASSVAVIAERDYAWPELIEDGVTGVLCSSSDEFAFRASELAFNDSLRQRIVESAAKRLVSEHGNRERSFGAWNQIL